MILIRQTVPHRHACVFRQFFHDFLAETPVFDSIEHPAQHPRCVLNALFLSHLGTCRPEICSSHAHIMCCDLKCTARPRTVFLEDQRHILSFIIIHRHTILLFLFYFCGKVDQISDLLRCEIL